MEQQGMGRREAPKAATRQALQEAGDRLFAERGFEKSISQSTDGGQKWRVVVKKVGGRVTGLWAVSCPTTL